MTKRFERLDLPELEAALESRKSDYERAFHEGRPYAELIDLYKEIKKIQHEIMLKKVLETA